MRPERSPGLPNTMPPIECGWETSSCFRLLPDAVAKTTHGLNQPLFLPLVYLASEQAHKCVQSVFLHLRFQPPSRFYNRPPRSYRTLPPHQKLQQLIFGRGQVNLVPSAEDLPRARVERQISDFQAISLGGCALPPAK